MPMTNTYKLMKIFKMEQGEVKEYAKKVLKQHGYTPNLGDGFIMAQGDLPVILVAHMDTVFKTPKYVAYDIKKGIMSAKTGLGADDRAGIYSILNIVESGYRPSILFLEDEEVGCIGAKWFITNKSAKSLKGNFFIELDRKGKDDAVYYDCINSDFSDYIESFGFKPQYGAYSDISVICPSFDLAGVNLSIGYYDQHTPNETLNINEMEDTIEKVKNILDQPNDIRYNYYTKEYYENERKQIKYKNYYGDYAYGWDYDECWDYVGKKSKSNKKKKNSKQEWEEFYEEVTFEHDPSFYEMTEPYRDGLEQISYEEYCALISNENLDLLPVPNTGYIKYKNGWSVSLSEVEDVFIDRYNTVYSELYGKLDGAKVYDLKFNDLTHNDVVKIYLN